MHLLDPRRSYATLIGTSAYQSLSNLPAVHNNLRELTRALTDPTLVGLPAEHCAELHNPSDARAVYRSLRESASRAEDTLLVYFAGHGLLSSRDELFLALGDTHHDELRVSALDYDIVREVIAYSKARSTVVILDCCFSGRAIGSMGEASDAAFAQVGIEGTYVLASSAGNKVSRAPVGASHTSFTGELIELLRTGIPEGQEFITLGEIYRRIWRSSTDKGLPQPRQRSTGTADLLALCRNVGVGSPSAPEASGVFPDGGSANANNVPAASTAGSAFEFDELGTAREAVALLQMKTKEAADVLAEMKSEHASLVLMRMRLVDPDAAAEVLGQIELAAAALLVTKMIWGPAADVLEHMPLERAAALAGVVPLFDVAAIFGEMKPGKAAALLTGMEPRRAAAVLGHVQMKRRRAVAVLKAMETGRRTALLDLLAPETAMWIRQRIVPEYPEPEAQGA
ncbi:caspase family protein [Streptomyces sp. NBC_00638]|uniref:caspase, EACC1-associated type n=1 Tax=Streptomyces sp. NBC_00638 TaxID=2975794 RepID=UPI00224D8F14|nr:caspase family protein [Streptomyces sp. NBC_00638]MCX5009152.1 caspase family protein [Streptomyces sp. NBC_00638]